MKREKKTVKIAQKFNKHNSHFFLFFPIAHDEKKMLSQIAEEGFLELINNILTIGMVPALFTDDETQTIIGNCQNAAKDAGYSVSK
jgi:hypothetical protein